MIGGHRSASGHWSALRWLIRPQRAHVAMVGVVAVLGGLAEALLLVAITRIGLAVAEGASRVEVVGSLDLPVGQAVAVAAGLVLARLVLALLMVRLAAGMSAAVSARVRIRLATAFFDASWAEQESQRSGKLAQLLTSFTTEALAAVGAVSGAVAALLSLAALLGAALVVHPFATLAIASVLVASAAVLGPIRRRVRTRSTRAVAAQSDVAAAVSELGGLGLEMQAFGVRDQFVDRLAVLLGRDVAARRSVDSLRHGLPWIYMACAYGALLAGLALAGRSADADLASVGAVLVVLLRSLTYGQQLQVMLGAVVHAGPYVDELRGTVEHLESSGAPGGSVAPPPETRFELSSVSFSYGGRNVLEDVSVVIEPGETVGVIGPSGAGKTTLVELLLGVREPTAGTVRVGPSDLRDLDRELWRGRVGFVAQTPQLITGTVEENVRFFRDGISDAAVRRAVADANVLADVEGLPDGFATHLGERGTRLSGGQRQRLSIARALAGAPSVLILDEPTSALDVESEALIRGTLAALRGSVTLVCIAHRLSTLDICDRLLVVEGGRLVVDGPAAEVRSNSDFFGRAAELSGLV